MTDFLDFKTLTRPESPNTYLVAPDGLCDQASPDGAPVEFDKSARGLFSTLAEMIAQERRWTEVIADPDQLRFKFVAKTTVMGFKDDVDIMIIEPEADVGSGRNTATLAIYSRSRVGYSDMGANRKRVNKLLQALTTK
ncbi:MAG: DUF1499 domain-containing protein [Pseudomonadota bacterium]